MADCNVPDQFLGSESVVDKLFSAIWSVKHFYHCQRGISYQDLGRHFYRSVDVSRLFFGHLTSFVPVLLPSIACSGGAFGCSALHGVRSCRKTSICCMVSCRPLSTLCDHGGCSYNQRYLCLSALYFC